MILECFQVDEISPVQDKKRRRNYYFKNIILENLVLGLVLFSCKEEAVFSLNEGSVNF